MIRDSDRANYGELADSHSNGDGSHFDQNYDVRD